MSFSIRLSEDLLTVDAGVTVPLGIEVANRGDEQNRFELEIEGLDPEWTAVPVPSFAVEPRENHIEKVFFKPGRASESVAGNYPFVVRVRSLVDGDGRNVQGVLNIKPYHHLSMDLNPKKGFVSPTKQQNDYVITAINLGNTEHTVQLYGNDPDDQCTFDFSQDQLTLGPGQQKEVNVKVIPQKQSLVAGTQLHGFSIGSRSVETPSVSASTQGQLEQRAVFSPGTLVAAFLFFLVALGWYLMRPKDPVMESLLVSKSTVNKGEDITVMWRASNARQISIEVNGKSLYEGTMTNGQKTFVADETGTVVAKAYRDQKASAPETVQFTVNPPVIAPDPEIVTFDLLPRQVSAGGSVTLRYKFNEAVKKATLVPKGLSLDPKIDTIQLDLDEAGKTAFYIVAENADGKTKKSRTLTVEVTTVSGASIIVFRAEPGKIEVPDGGTTKLVYQLEGAVRAEVNDGNRVSPLPDVKGELEITVEKTTTFTLIGYDKNGVTVKKTVVVTVSPPVTAPPDETTTGGDNSSTAGSATTGGRF